MNKIVTCQPQEKKKKTTIYSFSKKLYMVQSTNNHDFVMEISVFTCTSKGVGALVCLRLIVTSIKGMSHQVSN